MPARNNKYMRNIRNNIRQIRTYLNLLTEEEISRLYKDIQDVMQFYGYRNMGINYMLNYFFSDIPLEKETDLSKLEGMTNAILFHLKYKNEMLKN